MRCNFLVLAVFAQLLGTSAVHAQSAGKDLVDVLGVLSFGMEPPKYLSVQGVSTTRVAPHGTMFFAVSGSDRRPSGKAELDGSLVGGLGFGDQETGIGGQLSATITSTEPSDIGDSGYFGVKATTRILRDYGQNYLSVSVDHLASWGDATNDPMRVKLIGSRVGRWGPFSNGEFYPVLLTVGVSGLLEGDHDVDPFAGLGLGLSEVFSVSISHDSKQLNAGVGFLLKPIKNVAGSLTIEDVTEQQGDRRFVLSLGVAFSDLY